MVQDKKLTGCCEHGTESEISGSQGEYNVFWDV